VIYSIQKLFVEYLGGRDGVEAALARHAAAPGGEELAHMLPPLGRRCAWRLRRDFQFRCNALVFQYVVVKTAVAAGSFAAESAGTLCEGSTDFARCFSPWASLLVSLSQFGAMYGLVLFYHELQAELKPVGALAKLLAVKAVVFASFWQGIAIAGLEEAGLLQATEFYSPQEIVSGLQNFLICWEMAAAAFLHHYIFDYREVMRLAGAADSTMPLVSGGGRATPAAAVVMLLPQDAFMEAQGHLVAAAGVPTKLGEGALRAVRGAVGGRSAQRGLEESAQQAARESEPLV
jgi:hypothetical protein